MKRELTVPASGSVRDAKSENLAYEGFRARPGDRMLALLPSLES